MNTISIPVKRDSNHIQIINMVGGATNTKSTVAAQKCTETKIIERIYDLDRCPKQECVVRQTETSQKCKENAKLIDTISSKLNEAEKTIKSLENKLKSVNDIIQSKQPQTKTVIVKLPETLKNSKQSGDSKPVTIQIPETNNVVPQLPGTKQIVLASIICSKEDGVCRVPYPTTVVYGALKDNKIDDSNAIAIRNINSVTNCSNSVFGDPVKGATKICAYNTKNAVVKTVDGFTTSHNEPDEATKTVCEFSKVPTNSKQKQVVCGVGTDKKFIYGASSDIISTTRTTDGGFEVCIRNNKDHVSHNNLYCRKLDSNGNVVDKRTYDGWTIHNGK